MMLSFHIVLALYVAISIPLFLQVHNASELVIDEEFHLRQGRYYCEGNLSIVSFTLSYNLNNFNLISMFSMTSLD